MGEKGISALGVALVLGGSPLQIDLRTFVRVASVRNPKFTDFLDRFALCGMAGLNDVSKKYESEGLQILRLLNHPKF